MINWIKSLFKKKPEPPKYRIRPDGPSWYFLERWSAGSMEYEPIDYVKSHDEAKAIINRLESEETIYWSADK